MSLSQQPHYSAVHWLIPLLQSVSFILSYTIVGAKTRRVLRAMGAGDGVGLQCTVASLRLPRLKQSHVCSTIIAYIFELTRQGVALTWPAYTFGHDV